jgi:hypothetical protein
MRLPQTNYEQRDGRTYLKGESSESWGSGRGRIKSHCIHVGNIQGGSNMTGTDLCVNKPHKSRSYLNHHVYFDNMTEEIRKGPRKWTSLTGKLESRHNSANASDNLIQHLVLEAFAKSLKVTISVVMLVCPSALMEHLGSHWTDFYEIWYLSIF